MNGRFCIGFGIPDITLLKLAAAGLNPVQENGPGNIPTGNRALKRHINIHQVITGLIQNNIFRTIAIIMRKAAIFAAFIPF